MFCFLFILGTKTVMRFIVKLCVGDFLLLLDVREFDIEAVSLVNSFKSINFSNDVYRVLQARSSNVFKK